MKFILILFFLFVALVAPQHLLAQTWKPLGPDENDNPSLTFSTYTKVAIAPDGTVYIAFNDNTQNEKITVKRFDGVRWVIVGKPGFTEGYSSDIGLYFAPDGTPYVSYVTSQSQVVVNVRKFVSGDWVRVGFTVGSGIGPSLAFTSDGIPYITFSTAGGYGLAVEKFTNNWVAASSTTNVSGSVVNSSKMVIGSDGTPYVAYAANGDTDRISVKKLVSGQWQYVGKSGFTNQHMANVTLAIATDGTLYAAGQDTYNNSKAVVSIFKNGAWSDISNGGLSLGPAASIDLTVGPDLVPWIIFSDGGNTSKATILKYIGTTWVSADILSSGQTNYTSVAVSKNNTIYTCYTDGTLYDKVMVKSLTNNQWSEVASGGISSDASPIVLLQTSASGNEYTAFNDAFYNNKVSVKQYISGAWTYLGLPGLSPGNARSVDLAVAPDGAPYILYEDTLPSFAGIVKKYIDGSWQQLGGGITTGGGVANAKITIAQNGTPYVAYQDQGYAGQITVQNFTGGQWDVVGNQTFSSATANDIQIAIDQNNVPYVAYEDAASGNKVNVKKFDGTAWVSVGAADFSAGLGSNLSLVISPENIPYVAYYDQSTGLVIQSFINGSWTTVGNQPVATDIISNVKLIFNKSGELYLQYTQSGTNILTVTQFKKLVQGAWTDAGTNAMVPWNNLGSTLSVTPSGDILFAYLAPQLYVREQTNDSLAAAPIITHCTPNIGGAGTTATISGFNFGTVKTVKFGQSDATSFTVISPTTITAVVDTGATGVVSVTNAYGSAKFDSFTYTGAKPVITSFSPASGPVNTVVTVKGHHFGATASSNIVFFGAVQALVVSANDTVIQVKVPVGSTYEPLSVTARNLTAYANAPFDVTFKSMATIGTNSFAAPKNYSSIQNPSGLIIRDIDNDGMPDIITSGYGSMIYHNRNNGSNIILDTINITTTTGSTLATSDLDGDGKQDFLWANLVTFSLSKNNSSIGKPSLLPQEFFQPSLYAYIAQTADIDGDGRPDIIVNSYNAAYIAIMRNSSADNNSIYLEDETDIPLDGTTLSFSVADLDGDGKPDLIVLEPNYNNFAGYGYLVIYKNTSTQHNISFTKIAQYDTGISPQTPVVADIDGDGKPDIIIPNKGSNTLTVYQNRSAADIAFSNGTDITTGSSPNAVCVADLDGDGKPDLAVVNAAANTISVFRNLGGSGNLSFSAKTDYPTGAAPWNVAAADLDGDGAPELIVTNHQDNSISIFRNNIIEPNISQTNFTVAVTSATCEGSDNGSISINAAQALNYTAAITGPNVNKSIQFTTSAKLDSLAPGTYNVCISLQNDASLQQCYSLIVIQPKDLSVYVATNPYQNNITLSMSGGGTYHINLNSKLYSTTDSIMILPLTIGDNYLNVSTDKACQGMFNKVIHLSDVTIYPNPFQQTLSINTGNISKTNTVIEIRSIGNSKIVYKQAFGNISGILQLNLPDLSDGAYALVITADHYHEIFKIIKK